MRNDAYFNRIWYEREPPPWWTRVLAVLFGILSGMRRGLYRAGILKSTRIAVPVVMIGNIAVGGTGKTPLTIALVKLLRENGYSPGVISRGYGGRVGAEALRVSGDTNVERSGDEALMLARRTGVPVYIHPRRARAARRLLAENSVDVIIGDDGLQHYALSRDVEIAVIDGQRGLGNGLLLPAGPLRERAVRLRRVNHVVVNGEMNADMAAAVRNQAMQETTCMRFEPVALVNLASGERVSPDALVDERCVAIAGIGNPQRFFSSLGDLGYHCECHAFPDHHAYGPDDFVFTDGRPLLMTEKDAVKCQAFAKINWWYFEIGAVLEREFTDELLQQLAAIRVPTEENGNERHTA